MLANSKCVSILSLPYRKKQNEYETNRIFKQKLAEQHLFLCLWMKTGIVHKKIRKRAILSGSWQLAQSLWLQKNTGNIGKKCWRRIKDIGKKYVKQLNVNHIFLQTERNLPAYSFYIKSGFSELKAHASLVKIFDWKTIQNFWIWRR